MFEKILIANRGEIACRVAATARRMGVRTVAVYSDADAQAAHVQACDQAVWIGEAAPAKSYLLGERIIQAALQTGAQAIHPGYGFLSENPAFAQACVQAGLVLIGPPASAMQAMGLKAESKRLMAAAGVPLVPGYHGEDQSPDVLQREANAMGYPVLIKASAGGGGKGMRIVERAEDFAAALASCQREGQNSFGNPNVLIEKYVQRPRHIEIQVFADTHGQTLHLFERDCSVQRRHQKVLEEAPAPGLSAELRERMGQAAVAAARAVGYVGAGTVEFIVEQSAKGMDFFFMEMNTRLQVEHPVTEAITGLDLVEWQLRVAAGEALPLTQAQIQLQGHAIEARICAESPERDFLPATGRLQVLRVPASVSFTPGDVRWDSGVRAGDTITPNYDPMIAKLIVHGRDREQALRRLDQALRELNVVGLDTNIDALRRIVNCRSFAQADLDTALIAREREAILSPLPASAAQQAALSVLAVVNAQRQHGVRGEQDIWSRTDAWQAWGQRSAVAQFEVTGAAPMQIHTVSEKQGHTMATCHGETAPLSAQALDDEGGEWTLQWGRTRWRASVHAVLPLAQPGQPQAWMVKLDAGSCRVVAQPSWTRPEAAAGAGGGLTSPMPGKVVSFAVKAGDSVKAGQAVAVVEAMKMEHTLHAPHDGTVAELFFAPGDLVAEGDPLLKLDKA
ncbi:MAG: Acetyl-/propionyl-coenzyme carboxylase alpha chain [Pseudomonadota bacterium]